MSGARHAAVPTSRQTARLRARSAVLTAAVTAVATGSLVATGAMPALGVTPTAAGAAAPRPGQCAPVGVGSTGPVVAALQRIVRTPADGGFGPATLAALTRWQTAHRLRATGVVDAATWQALPNSGVLCGTPFRRLAPKPTAPCPGLQPGDSGPAVAAVQSRLRVSPPGWFGPRTAAAVIGVQRMARITPVGPVGLRTFAALHLIGTPACASATGVDALSTSRPTSAGTPTPSPAPAPTPSPKPTLDPVLEARRAAIRTQVAATLTKLANSPTTTTDVTATAAVRAAMGTLGTPYVYGGATPKGFDCSGLVMWAYGRAGLRTARVAAEQYKGGALVPLAQAAPGDLVFSALDVLDPATIYHVGIYLGAGKMVESPRSGLTVRVRAVSGSGVLPMVARPAALLRLPVGTGATGFTVVQVQRALVAAGYAVSVDGGYGPQTATAVKAVQRKAGLPVTGTVDVKTWAAITGDGA